MSHISVTDTHSQATSTDSTPATLHKQWVLASNNKGKLTEFKRLFSEANLDVTIIPQGQLDIDDAIEDGLSFIENAIIKARHASRASGLPAIADDSGLCVPVLGNAPGIYSARYAGEHGNDAKNNAKLIADLQPIRNAQANKPINGLFVCVLVMVRHANDPLPIVAQGLWHGEILESPHGEGGFGYDPLFWLPELQATAASLSAADKNSISHRGQAIEQLLAQLHLLPF
ncbi:RdgB/HAM1 family non-canonical purine NTP pyrophosphatase [Psychrobacter sp. ANT_WB68]|uniref:RdgB/HAM1 family non-canonical purine NTP pyrophosphatase n=1 Tax=Psychrobacter sp. ANT_WB68 TaxID=2597355 RepID=UPI0011F1F0AE|nr:RdgB/HAM1 family non-canonical purine NTP pyrophosphatase [Psychrobacter sp. ANT_WB68]KAA0912553.1 RdgB/HAM1 family non-canonical purine NTP pyrophosphatase [Psychrobacter sp. ANT_WB68]